MGVVVVIRCKVHNMSVQHGYRKPENPRKKPVKAGTGQVRFEIFRFQVSQTRPERGLERHGFSREIFSIPEDPKMPLSQIKHFYALDNSLSDPFLEPILDPFLDLL